MFAYTEKEMAAARLQPKEVKGVDPKAGINLESFFRP